MLNEEIINFYNKNASKYYEERVLSGGSLFNEYIEIPAVIKLLNEDIVGKRILDIGCGLGVYSKLLSEKGGIVTAIDSSKEMIRYAKMLCADLRVTFIHQPFESFAPRQEETFDIILGSFMLSYFDDLLKVFSNIFKFLSSSGYCIMSMLHPLRLSSLRDESGVYSIFDYFDNKSIYASDFLDNKEILHLKKWTISDITYAASNSGLLVDLIIEPKPQNIPPQFVNPKTSYLEKCPSVIIFKFVKNNSWKKQNH
jgi:2-polyprenyl-3-methyl-5-hydroxy-6-metoxy-1,4-benzoquinol methylase